jgi:hypothetical protein
MFRLKQIILFSILATMFSCAKSDKNDLKEAQICLDNSAPSEARACLSKISSNESPQAYKLRCAAVFISEGFNTSSSFIAALDKLTNPSGGCTTTCSSTVAAISALTFKNANNANAADRSRSNAAADEAFSYCSLAETNIYMQISSLFKIGTSTANSAYVAMGGAATGATPTADQIQTALGTLNNTDMGNLAVATYGATCQDTSKASDSTKAYCAQLGASVKGGGTTDQIGACLKGKLANPSYSNPVANCP